MPTIPVLAANDTTNPGPPVRLRAADWARLAALDGRRDVPDVAAAVGQAPERVAAALDALVRAGLVTFRAPDHAPESTDAPDRVAPPAARSSTR